ncbi:MAG: GNAT family N-acetyltransferase [Deltaproteobacteria bacterium]|nr:GNAT family N-acetyltransferase [Deltaproteobacteria bacterium]
MNFETRYISLGEDTLTLRRVEVSDAPWILDFFNCIIGETDFLLSGPEDRPLSLEDEISFIKSFDKTPNSILVAGFFNNQLCSIVDIRGAFLKRREHIVELGLSVKKSFWRKHIATEMMNSILSTIRNQRSIKKVTLKVHENNTSAIALYKKCGFVQEGLLMKDLKIKENFYSTLVMSKFL